MNMKELGDLISEARISRGISQQKLAKLAGTSRASLIALEKGRREPFWAEMTIIEKKLKIKTKLEEIKKKTTES